MKLIVRSLGLAVVMLALATAGLSAHPTFVEETVINFWNLRDHQNRIRVAQDTYRELDRKDQIVLRRSQLKVNAIDELLADRIAFEEAVEQFVGFHRGASDGQMDLERAMMQVISYLRASRTDKGRQMAEERECMLMSSEWSNDVLHGHR